MAIFCGNIEGFYELVNGQLGIAACASILKQTNKQKNRQASRRDCLHALDDCVIQNNNQVSTQRLNYKTMVIPKDSDIALNDLGAKISRSVTASHATYIYGVNS
ncbi:hypothetical protein P5673_002389 [Acropora cervicornis]|uniref:Uncharacterized protein n=1 Tax=Acropora cervicornis TaxID=6130 RepID=A0AAD9VF67_ACRCE|nr:hypothetical protein P5673_002389 [Acropora cervicornis]